MQKQRTKFKKLKKSKYHEILLTVDEANAELIFKGLFLRKIYTNYKMTRINALKLTCISTV